MKTRFHLLFIGMFLTTLGTGLSQPVITNQPQSTSTCVGTDATFTVGAEGAPPLFYQWQRSTDGTTYLDLAGQTNSTLVITNAHGRLALLPCGGHQLAGSGYQLIGISQRAFFASVDL